MLDKDKLWIQINVYVKGIADGDVPEYLHEIAQRLNLDESVRAFFKPTEDETLPQIQVLHPRFYKEGEEVDEITYEDFTDEQNVKFRKVLHNGVFLGEIEILPDEQ